VSTSEEIGSSHGTMVDVPTEDLIGSLSGEDNFRMLGRFGTENVGSDGDGVSDGLIKVPHNFFQMPKVPRSHSDLVEIKPHVVGCRLRVGRFVMPGTEIQAERLHGKAQMWTGPGGNGGGIQAAADE
jgi:hypothetical protein